MVKVNNHIFAMFLQKRDKKCYIKGNSLIKSIQDSLEELLSRTRPAKFRKSCKHVRTKALLFYKVWKVFRYIDIACIMNNLMKNLF